MNLVLDRQSRTPLTEQLFAELKRMITCGAAAADERLPSSRELATQLQISRTVTVAVYERLAAERYVYSGRGSGTFVAPGVALTGSLQQRVRGGADRIPRIGFEPLRTDIIDFRTGVPDLRFFPVGLWQRLQRETWSRLSARDLAYSAPEGRAELREAIAGYLRMQRGVVCSPEQILITSGTTQAISLLSAAIAGKVQRGRAAVEEPVTADIPRIINHAGVESVAVRVDAEGMAPEGLAGLDGLSFAYVTPSHHYPLGISMPAGRRTAIIEVARRKGIYLVEDDYDSELRYGLPPVSTLYELDPSRVAYVGTFSKTLAPALRAAFIVLPWDLVAAVRSAKWLSDLHNASPEQLVLASFVEKGHYARHIAAMRRRYERKWIVVRETLDRVLGSAVEILGSPAGIHVAVRVRGGNFNRKRLEAVETLGARFYPVSLHSSEPQRWRDCLVIGFGHLDEDSIARGIELLGQPA